MYFSTFHIFLIFFNSFLAGTPVQEQVAPSVKCSRMLQHLTLPVVLTILGHLCIYFAHPSIYCAASMFVWISPISTLLSNSHLLRPCYSCTLGLCGPLAVHV